MSGATARIKFGMTVVKAQQRKRPTKMSNRNPLDVLALAAHPDDVELCAGGTMCLLAEQGYHTAVVDFTRGELGSRGTPEGRLQEAQAASEIMGLAARDNLGLPDGDIANTRENQRALIRLIRRHRPHTVIINSPECRHPDHCAAEQLAADACYYSGLRKIETHDDDGAQNEPWRPQHILHYMQDVPFEPSLIVDVTDVWDRRIEALQAFKSQFFNPKYDPDSDEPETFVSNRDFFDWIEARARVYGQQIGVRYGEPFLYHRGAIGTTDLVDLLKYEKEFR